uniref:Histone H2A n=1 Tax=Tanacetum cinerariifolium TaxID=118510 RepID=A0A6L2KAP8_TANCI|nr:histone H2A [Tanacetum cinerariifolium]
MKLELKVIKLKPKETSLIGCLTREESFIDSSSAPALGVVKLTGPTIPELFGCLLFDRVYELKRCCLEAFAKKEADLDELTRSHKFDATSTINLPPISSEPKPASLQVQPNGALGQQAHQMYSTPEQQMLHQQGNNLPLSYQSAHIDQAQGCHHTEASYFLADVTFVVLGLNTFDVLVDQEHHLVVLVKTQQWLEHSYSSFRPADQTIILEIDSWSVKTFGENYYTNALRRKDVYYRFLGYSQGMLARRYCWDDLFIADALFRDVAVILHLRNIEFTNEKETASLNGHTYLGGKEFDMKAGGLKKKPVLRFVKAGLQFPVGRYAHRVGSGALVYHDAFISKAGGLKKKPVLGFVKAGLQFPVVRYAHRVSSGAWVYHDSFICIKTIIFE